MLEMIRNAKKLQRSKFRIEVLEEGKINYTVYKVSEKDFYNIVDNIPLDNKILFKAYIGECLYCRHIKA